MPLAVPVPIRPASAMYHRCCVLRKRRAQIKGDNSSRVRSRRVSSVAFSFGKTRVAGGLEVGQWVEAALAGIRMSFALGARAQATMQSSARIKNEERLYIYLLVSFHVNLSKVYCSGLLAITIVFGWLRRGQTGSQYKPVQG